jgi:superfamily II DNA or RNA helicase
MTTTADQIRRLLGEVTFARGLVYSRNGHVVAVERQADGEITAKVRGNAARPYTQTIAVGHDAGGGLRRITGECSCPVGYNCKHVAAALLALASRETIQAAPQNAPLRQAPRPTVEASLSPALRTWLAELQAADSPGSVDDDAYPAGVKDRLLYVLEVSDEAVLKLEPVKATLLKDGGFSRSVRRYDASGLGWREPARFVRPADQRILHRLKLLGLDPDRLAPRTMAALARPMPGEVLELLALIARTGRGRWANAHGPALAEAGPRFGRLVWRDQENGRQRLAAVDAEGQRLAILPIEPAAYVDPETGALGRLELDTPPGLTAALLKAPEIPPEAASVVAKAIAGLRTARPPAPRAIGAETRTGIVPIPVLQLLAISARRRLGRWSGIGPAFMLPVLRLAFDYAGQRVAAFPFTDPQFREGDTIVTLGRDREAEKRAHDRLAACGTGRLDQWADLAVGREALGLDRVFEDVEEPGHEAAGVALEFMAEELPLLRSEGWRVEIDQSWPYRLHEGPVAIRAGIESGDGGWFSVGLTLDAAGQRLDLAPLILSIIEGLPLAADGTLAEDFELDAFLEDLVLYQRLEDGSHVPIEAGALAPLVEAFLAAQGLLDGFHPAEAARVAALAEALDGCGVPFEGGDALLELGRKLAALGRAPMVAPPASLEAELRPYQNTGYGWLRVVATTGFGAVLADDMGLGKTVQALALLAHLHLEIGSDRPSLLIAPTSLVGTWRREAARFVPGLKVLVLHGPDRHARFAEMGAHHLVVTTYPLLHRDHERLFARAYELAILDEAQAVKNPASSAARHIRKVEARTRLALTGTPVENNLEDLWTLFDWLIPGLLGNRKAFRARFRQAIEKNGDVAAQALLNARIRPFVLRRTKAEVAADLPPKTEIVETVTLGPGQRGLYETIRLTMDARVQRAIAERGLAGSRITILTALLKLRQVCCDPVLLPTDHDRPAGRAVTESAKRERLMEMLEALIAEGRRVLVFSQFVSMLRLIEADVKAKGWDYAWLTGETQDREAVVARFQAGRTPIFLISLKAGGVGLTLTAAETVILYDPWWNPAVERQAMDRAHRIGQDRAVFVYRLVAEGSVEEAIMALQAKKQAMADALFEGEASGPLGLEEADLASLFRPMAAG